MSHVLPNLLARHLDVLKSQLFVWIKVADLLVDETKAGVLLVERYVLIGFSVESIEGISLLTRCHFVQLKLLLHKLDFCLVHHVG